eukprot:PhF_6_TR1063/c0_g1_i1/m.2235
MMLPQMKDDANHETSSTTTFVKPPPLKLVSAFKGVAQRDIMDGSMKHVVMSTLRTTLLEDDITFSTELECLEALQKKLEANVRIVEELTKSAGDVLSSPPTRARSRSMKSAAASTEERTRMNVYRSQYYANLVEHERLCFQVICDRINTFLIDNSTASQAGGSSLMSQSLTGFGNQSIISIFSNQSGKGSTLPSSVHTRTTMHAVIQSQLIENPTIATFRSVVDDCLHEWQKCARFQELRNRVMESRSLLSPVSPTTRSKRAYTSGMSSAGLMIARAVQDPLGDVHPHLVMIQHTLMQSLHASESSELVEALNRTSTELHKVESKLSTVYPSVDLEVVLNGVEEFFFPSLYKDLMHVIATYVARRDDIALHNNSTKFHFATQTHMNIAEEYQSDEPLPFIDAVYILRTLPVATCPLRKLDVVKSASTALLQCMVQNAARRLPVGSKKREEILVGGDDFVPAFIYCLMVADLPNLASELSFINCFLNPDVCSSEMGYYCTTLELATEFLKTMTFEKLNLSTTVPNLSLTGSPNLESTASATYVATLETTLCQMHLDDEVRVRTYILPRLKHVDHWVKDCEGLIKLVRSRAQLVGYKTFLVLDWLRDDYHLVKGVFVYSGSPDDIAIVSVCSSSTQCATAQQFFLDSLFWCPLDAGVEAVNEQTSCGAKGCALVTAKVDSFVSMNDSPAPSVKFSTDKILSGSKDGNDCAGVRGSFVPSDWDPLQYSRVLQGLITLEALEANASIDCTTLQDILEGFNESDYLFILRPEDCDIEPFEKHHSQCKVLIIPTQEIPLHDLSVLSQLYKMSTQLQCMLEFLHFRLREIPLTGFIDSTTQLQVGMFVSTCMSSQECLKPTAAQLRRAYSFAREMCANIANALTSFGFPCRFPLTREAA